MEDEDDRIPEPDSKGYLSLTNRAWVHLDPVLFGYSLSLVSLDVSYNSILELPGQIEIGRLKRLRKLHAQGNRLTALPIEVGRLEMLEELILSENEMEELPDTISLLTNLRIFKLQNNKLRALPYDISALFSLEVLDVGNNDTLTMVPKLWRSNTDSVLFICKIHQDYGVKMGDMLRTNHDLTRHSQYLEQEQLKMKEIVEDLQFKLEELRRHMPKKAMEKMEQEQRLAADRDGQAASADTSKKKKGQGGGCSIS